MTTPIEAPAPSRAESSRNYRLGVINGFLFTLGDTLSSSGLVMALLVRQLGGSLVLVGLLPALQSGGYLLPQMLIGGRLQAMRYNMPIYHRAAIARLLAFFSLVVATFLAGAIPAPFGLAAVVICYMIFNIGGGTSTLAFQNIVAKTIPPRRRGNFFGHRQLFGGLLGFAIAGPLVRWLLGDNSPLAFPSNFGTLTVLAWFAYAIGLLAFSLIREPPSAETGSRMRLIDTLHRAPQLLREDYHYRWSIVARILNRIGLIGEPFYIIYAVEHLGLPASVSGIYLAVRAITAALSNLLWSRLSERRGALALVSISGMLIACIPFLALFAPLAAQALGLGTNGQLIAMGLVFLMSGVANDGSNIAGNTYVMEIAPERERPIYIGVANTIYGTATFVPVVGGWMVEAIGFRGVFGIGLAFSLISLLAVWALYRQPRLGGQLEGEFPSTPDNSS